MDSREAKALAVAALAHSLNAQHALEAQYGSRKDAERWAARVGFTERQVPYATAKALTLKTARKGAPVYPSEIREALEHTQPHIFLDPAQQKLFSEEAL